VTQYLQLIGQSWVTEKTNLLIMPVSPFNGQPY
jgi:hypothetical protein